MKVKLLDCDTPLSNGLIYPQDEVERVLDNTNLPLLGRLGCPEVMTLNLADAAFTIDKLMIENGSLYGELNILDTPKGRILKEVFDVDNNDFRTIGIGTLDESNTVSNYKILGAFVVPKSF
jgi:hypothetical protein